MSIWKHSELYGNVKEFCDLGFFKAQLNLCHFCGTKLNSVALDVNEFISAPDLISIFKTDLDVTRRDFPEYFIGLPDSYFELVDNEPSNLFTYCHVCEFCGWWVADYRGFLGAKDMIWQVIAGVTAALRNFDISDISTPILDVRSFLSGRYDARNTVHPRKYEEVVASVFADLGYRVELTSYSRDGGIDVLLENGSNCIGVQVKKSKNKIQVDAIRSFVGALMIGGVTKGIYVATSGFTRGAKATADIASKSIMPIKLWNASSFLEALKVAQLSRFDYDSIIETVASAESWAPIAFHNLNSL